jgi:hypothetical protein
MRRDDIGEHCEQHQQHDQPESDQRTAALRVRLPELAPRAGRDVGNRCGLRVKHGESAD